MRHRAFAAAMGLATAALFITGSQSQAASADPTGYWMKPDAERESKIQVFKCGTGKKLLCAKIAWLKDPKDSKGKLLTDVRNENPSLRNRQIVGLAIFTGLSPSAPSTWTGKIYNPEDGKTYSATLTVLSRSKILLKGCKAWLLCGERHWLRTAAPPEELQPTAPAEGTEQIEASLTPSSPAKPAALAPAQPENVATEVPLPTRAPEPPVEMAVAEPVAPITPQAETPVATPVALVTQAAAAATPAAEYNWRQGYGFLNVATAPEPAKLSGENVPSMFVMAEPIATDSGAVASQQEGQATAALGAPAPAPAAKPKTTPKPVIANAAAKPAPKPSTAPKPAGQAAPAPQEAEATQAAAADAGPGATAEAAMVDDSALTRRQKRLLRRQQMQQEPFLPWLR